MNLLDLYRDFLLPMTPSKEISDLLSTVMSGGETTQDFANLIDSDPELKDWIDTTAQRIGRSSRSPSTEYKVSILGLNRVRNMIVGRHIERALVPEEQTQLALLLKEREKNSSGKKNDEETPDEEKIVPDFGSFAQYTSYAVRAENAAIEIKCSFSGQAYAGGALFDYLRVYFSTRSYDDLVEEQRFKKPEKYVEELFEDGLRCALAAEEITKFIQIRFQRNVFFSSLIRNIGKGLLLAYDPAGYERAVKSHTESKKAGVPVRSSETEEDEFEMDHAQLSALYVGRVAAFQGLEKSIDYHHNPRLLKSRDKELYALSCILRLAGLLCAQYQEFRTRETDIHRIPDRKIIEGEIFQFLKLTPEEWRTVKQNYSMNLIKLGL
jgi:hypothetical protein